MMPMVKLLMLLLPASLSSMVGARATRDYQLLDRNGMPRAMCSRVIQNARRPLVYSINFVILHTEYTTY